MRKLPVGQRIHAWESKHNKCCCSCWSDCETDDHLFQCPKRACYQNEIYQVIKRLGKNGLRPTGCTVRWSNNIPHGNKTNEIYYKQQQQTTDRLLELNPSGKRRTRENNGR